MLGSLGSSALLFSTVPSTSIWTEVGQGARKVAWIESFVAFSGSTGNLPEASGVMAIQPGAGPTADLTWMLCGCSAAGDWFCIWVTVLQPVSWTAASETMANAFFIRIPFERFA